MTTPAMTDLKATRAACVAFAKTHLAECAAELIEWQDTAILRDGRVRELAELCNRFVGNHDGLRVAESLINRAAVEAQGAPPQQVVAGSIDSPEFSALAARYATTKAGKDYMAIVAHIDARQAAPVCAEADTVDATLDTPAAGIPAIPGTADHIADVSKMVALCQTQDETRPSRSTSRPAEESSSNQQVTSGVGHIDQHLSTTPSPAAQQQAGAVPDERELCVARYQYWKNWWMNSADENDQIPPEVGALMDDLDLDEAFDAAIRAAAATDERKES